LGLARLSAGDAAGSGEIRQARQMDPDIDELFIMMGLLPGRCDQGAAIACPKGFPPLPLGDQNLIVVKGPDATVREIMRMAGQPII
jgi:hypothetical protein